MTIDPTALLNKIQNEDAEKRKVTAAPIVHKMAKEDGVDLSQIKGSGNNGAITKADYEAHTGKQAPAVNMRAEDERGVMNHALEDQETIGGMEFRRSRGVLDHSTTKKLDIPSQYKNNELEYRWVNDIGGSVQQAKDLGYALVQPGDLSKDEEISVRRRVGSGQDGSDQYAVLMATPKKWKQERQAKAEDVRRSREDGMFRKPSDSEGQLGSEFYMKENSGFRK